ncbi:MAG: TIGR02677 family protein [Clostridiales bacterium]|nr:TIGR02677 family protein [Clostridiales bacterium]
MQITEKLLKPITETAYLTAINAGRYRAIVRCFYIHYEKMKFWLSQDEVFYEISSHSVFADYTQEQCRLDLNQLTEWQNLIATQDTSKVYTIEDFRNRKFRYQLSEYSVEIERMTIKLENLFVDGASLEPTLMERLRAELAKALDLDVKSELDVYAWWDTVNSDFVRLNQNYQDYIRDLNSAKAEDLMKTAAFIAFKDKLVEYLRTFVKSLQKNTAAIESILRKIPQERIERILDIVVRHEMSVPRLEVTVSPEELRDMMHGRWESIYDWFAGGDYNEAQKLFNSTDQIIRKITRYASQIIETYYSGASRKDEYRKIFGMFMSCDSMAQAHKLSAMVFGVERPLHVSGDFYRETDDIYSGVYDEPAFPVVLTSKSRIYAQTARKHTVASFQAEKARTHQLLMDKARREQQILESFIRGGVLDFGLLPEIEPEIRGILLNWLSRGLHSGGIVRTELGRNFEIDDSDISRVCDVRCTDGVFTMPRYKLKKLREGLRLRDSVGGIA